MNKELNYNIVDEQILKMLNHSMQLRILAEQTSPFDQDIDAYCLYDMAVEIEEAVNRILFTAEDRGLISRDDWRTIRSIVNCIGTGITMEERL